MQTLPEAAEHVNERELGRLVRSLAGKSVTASYVLDPGDNIVRFDTTSGNLVATLPAAALMQERFVTIKKTSVDANTVTVTPATGETIDGAVSTVLSTQWQSYTFYSDGTRWSIIWVYDTAIPANIAAEAATRAAADSAEASTRASADSAEATARANADSLLQAKSEKNAASGYAGLDASSKLTGSQQVYGSAANTACQGNDSRLSDARTPTGHHASHEPGGGDAMAVDAAAATGSLRTLGTGATQAAPGTEPAAAAAAAVASAGVTNLGGGGHATGVTVTGTLAASVGTLDLDTTFGGGQGFAGMLIVSNSSTVNAGVRTQRMYAVFGRGAAATFTQLATVDGGSGAATFTMGMNGNGVIRLTNTYAPNSTAAKMTWIGHDGN